MRHVLKFALIGGLTLGAVAPASAGDPVAVIGQIFGFQDVVAAAPPRRYLTTYMASYPFGVLREDYTPLGAPGVSKRDYYGVPRLTATLHTRPRRYARQRTVLSTRY